jgi:hypothetical protein
MSVKKKQKMNEKTEIDFYSFPNCMHALNAALHRENIDPTCVVLEMPFEQWWRLSQVLQSKFKNLLWHDGRQSELTEFTYMGFKFVCKGKQK